jgi:SAM-dependent methyltransferase
VLDLATGDGAVLGKIRRSRADLKLTGVDSAARLPPAPKGMTLRSGIAMEALPFPDGSFDLVTSQFGFEYGDRAAIAREVARVLAPDRNYAFIVHHAAGPILAHNVARRGGLVWAVVDSNLLPQARALVRARQLAPLPTPERFRNAPGEAHRLFPGQSVATEFVTAILQTLELGRRSPPSMSLEALDELERKGRNEIARIDSLANAACAASDIDAIEAALVQARLTPAPRSELFEQGGAVPFAWFLTGRR